MPAAPSTCGDPFAPTTHPPGSAAKIRVLARRAAANESRGTQRPLCVAGDAEGSARVRGAGPPPSADRLRRAAGRLLAAAAGAA